ncbi:hypothetical protein [Escherichia coli]|uniref:hypothetical protein n=1 Tax=Escherichia coli TaxID=562 RepID=UPI0035BC9515
MAEQTSRLAIIIDSTGAKNNADNLTSSLVKMTQAGETAANSAGKVTIFRPILICQAVMT